MSKRLVVFDSHPVQYRVPIWRLIQKERPGLIHVVYASDCSVRGHADKGFGQTVAWDDPMLDGYDYTVLNCEKGTPLSGPESLTGEGVAKSLDNLKPDIVLLTGLNYRFDKIACKEAAKRGIPVWLRCETQDEAMVRSPLKTVLRHVFYRIWYRKIAKAFYIGRLNKQHYLRHGIKTKNLLPAFYATVDRFAAYTDSEKAGMRAQARSTAGIPDNAIVIGFSGKFITKKNPGILFSMLEELPEALKSRIYLYFIGSGELKQDLQQAANETEKKHGIKSFFSGFVNQSELAKHYLALDILILPSRRRGETWGLVSNEAMQAGCSVIVSNAVGCYADFSGWERFRVFNEGDQKGLARAVNELTVFPREFNWASENLKPYSIESIASAFVGELQNNKLL